MQIGTRRRLMAALGVSIPALAAWPAAAGLIPPPDETLRDVIENGPRTPADKARDVYRHPYASLVFWGLKPGMTVIDVSPGAGSAPASRPSTRATRSSTAR